MAAALLVSLVPAGVVAADGSAGPRLVVDAPRAHLGQVISGSVQEHVFEFRNAGDQDLKIERIQPS